MRSREQQRGIKNKYELVEFEMYEIEVKWIHAIQVWWSWLWRTVL